MFLSVRIAQTKKQEDDYNKMIEKKASEQISRDYEAGEVNRVWFSQESIKKAIAELKKDDLGNTHQRAYNQALDDFEEMIKND